MVSECQTKEREKETANLNQAQKYFHLKDYRVILMDSIVATGAAALMAVRVLLDHDVPEENISLGERRDLLDGWFFVLPNR